MADVQILRSAVAANAVVYTLPDAAELRLKAVFAEYTDNGAASSWVPCIEIRSDSNDTIAFALDLTALVAAGDDASVSWFPGVKGGSASGTSALPFLVLQGILTNVANPPVGDTDHGKFDATKEFTNSPGSWTYTLDAGGNIKEIKNAEAGLFDVTLQYKWAAAAAAFDRTTLINVNGIAAETFNGVTIAGVSPDDRVKTLDVYDGTIRALFPLSAPGGIINVQPVNSGAAAVNFTPVYLSIVQHPLSS